MSIYYEVCEHLVMEDEEKHHMVLSDMGYRLSLMAAWSCSIGAIWKI